ncbi:hypothetical protein HAP41_0000044680 [Bradyrhizobium barranii subsp. apii]|uniref:Uncharacterized protein n=1 Tax=Bradyrhizobium barranii subsp. apii TaxID=2819348 RepID=A0A8U0FL14_9BRAD|nr:hypothetical protein [Bradyrhizobium barranii]UPT87179.1 hypothetical protein HAP41_0000044680 [Bradyrhizobium barranii subsp. apii]UPT95787.1 hypothetical protein J4G48_0042490 [Bradyrhizobium barranii subsp. apii]
MQSASKENGSIKIVGPADRPKVIAVLTTAFTTCLLLRWLYPEPERYLRHFAGFLEYYAGDPYFDGSGAYLEDGQKGALLWVTDKAHRNDKRMMEYLLGSVPLQSAPYLQAGDAVGKMRFRRARSDDRSVRGETNSCCAICGFDAPVATRCNTWISLSERSYGHEICSSVTTTMVCWQG